MSHRVPPCPAKNSWLSFGSYSCDVNQLQKPFYADQKFLGEIWLSSAQRSSAERNIFKKCFFTGSEQCAAWSFEQAVSWQLLNSLSDHVHVASLFPRCSLHPSFICSPPCNSPRLWGCISMPYSLGREAINLRKGIIHAYNSQMLTST